MHTKPVLVLAEEPGTGPAQFPLADLKQEWLRLGEMMVGRDIDEATCKDGADSYDRPNCLLPSLMEAAGRLFRNGSFLRATKPLGE